MDKWSNKKEFESKISLPTVHNIYRRIYTHTRAFILHSFIRVHTDCHQFKWRWTVSNTSGKKTLFIFSFFFFIICFWNPLWTSGLYDSESEAYFYLFHSDSPRLRSIRARTYMSRNNNNSNNDKTEKKKTPRTTLLLLLSSYRSCVRTTTAIYFCAHNNSIIAYHTSILYSFYRKRLLYSFFYHQKIGGRWLSDSYHNADQALCRSLCISLYLSHAEVTLTLGRNPLSFSRFSWLYGKNWIQINVTENVTNSLLAF